MFRSRLAVGVLAAAAILPPSASGVQATDQLLGTWSQGSPGQTITYGWSIAGDGSFTWSMSYRTRTAPHLTRRCGCWRPVITT